MSTSKAVLLSVVCSLLTAIGVWKLDRNERGQAIATAFADGRVSSNVAVLTEQVSKLRAKIKTLVSVDEAIDESKDAQLNQAISRLYNDGSTPEQSADLSRALLAQAWQSLKYRIIFDQDPDLK